eukprot:Gb_00148 [translate_table: standard]
MVMEVGRCGQYSSGFMRSQSLVNFGNDFQTSLWSPRKPRMFRTHSLDERKRVAKLSLKRTCSACFEGNGNNSSEEEYMKNLQELSLQCHMVDEESELKAESKIFGRFNGVRGLKERNSGSEVSKVNNSMPERSFSWPVSLGSKRNEVGLPLSLRILKRKQCKDKETRTGNLIEARQAAYTSIQKAFSSMVFMIRELQTYTLQLRQILFYEDLHELLAMVQREMQASFVWLFQQVFSCTPTLMVSVMILLANFTVYSMGNNVAVAATPLISPPSTISVVEDVKNIPNNETQASCKLIEANHTWVKVSNQSPPPLVNPDVQNSLSSGDGLGGGGRQNPAIASGADGDSHYEGDSQNHTVFSKVNSVKPSVSSLPNPVSANGEGMAGTLGSIVEDEDDNPADLIARDVRLWQSFLKEHASASKEDILNEAALDPQTMQSLVSPVTAQLEPDNYTCYDRTDLLYQHAISKDPDNPLLLSNYAQFLHLVRHDHDRAEEYFRQALRSDSVDGEAIASFANFLWVARGDLSAAEKAYLDAIAADPWNPFHAGSYAHFLWHTGGAESSYSESPTI